MIAALKQRARSLTLAWARRRQGRDDVAAVLDSRRVYILPTAQGVAFGALLFSMLLASMNYNASLGFILTFLLAGLGLVAIYHTHRNLVGLVVDTGDARAVFAGDPAIYEANVENRTRFPRTAIAIQHDGNPGGCSDIAAHDRTVLRFEVPTEKRGVVLVKRFGIATRFPLGLFRAWSWVHPGSRVIVYPRPARRSTPPPTERADTGGAQSDASGDEDFAGLRDYRPGDPPRHIAWKAFARTRQLLIKQHTGTRVETHLFDYDLTDGADVEAKLAQLARWIVDADNAGHGYGLRLPGRDIAAGLGPAHRHECLRALALFDGAAA